MLQRVKAESGSMGHDAASDTYVDMVAQGIIDPTKVTRIALQNAASVAALLLTTEALITELPEDKKPQRCLRVGITIWTITKTLRSEGQGTLPSRAIVPVGLSRCLDDCDLPPA